jgi:hypothetical protein
MIKFLGFNICKAKGLYFSLLPQSSSDYSNRFELGWFEFDVEYQ